MAVSQGNEQAFGGSYLGVYLASRKIVSAAFSPIM
jgi:hypothetical protein